MKKEFFGMKAKLCFLILTVFLMSQCANTQADLAALPKDIRGIKLEMPKADAHKRLEEIATFKANASKGQEVWTLKDDPNFENIMLGYDKKETVKYITVTVGKDTAKNKKRVKFSDVGSLASAEKESVQHINKYMWNVDLTNEMPEHQVYTYGEEEENLLHLSLVKRMDKEEDEKEKE